MKVSKEQTTRQDWDKVRSWNFKLPGVAERYQSVIYAELDGDHGEVTTKDIERIYYILEGAGEFNIAGEVTQVNQGDVITVPPNTRYDYRPTGKEMLKILLFMELWDN